MLLAVVPELLLAALALIVVITDLSQPQPRAGAVGIELLAIRRRRYLGIVTAVGFGLILLVSLLVALPAVSSSLIFGGMLRHDLMAFVFRLLFLFAGAVTALISID